MSPNSSYKIYRTTLNKSSLPCLPYMFVLAHSTYLTLLVELIFLIVPLLKMETQIPQKMGLSTSKSENWFTKQSLMLPDINSLHTNFQLQIQYIPFLLSFLVAQTKTCTIYHYNTNQEKVLASRDRQEVLIKEGKIYIYVQ